MSVRIEPPSVKELSCALRDRGERIAADQHGLGEIVGGRVDVAAVELVLVGERDGVHHEIDLAPFFPEHVEHRIDGRGIGDVAMAEQKAEFLRQRLDPLLQRVALPGEGDFRTGRMAGFGDTPGNRAAIGNAEYHSALALHQP